MIEEVREPELSESERLQQHKLTPPTRLMFRKLTAIEIAEGALLADIGVIFQLLAISLPVGGSFLRLLTPIVFAIIVLRQSLYVGCMSLVVALCTSGFISGPHTLVSMLLESAAGLFLGLTMKYRLRHLSIIFLGVTSGALASYATFILFDLLTGIPLSDLALGLRLAYKGLASFVGLIASIIGLGSWWQHTAFPAVDALAQLALTYWWITFYIATWIILLPVVIVVYYITNFFVRRLGHQVRPFPGGKLDGLFYWILRKLSRLIPKRLIKKNWLARTFVTEVRRLGIARQKTRV